MVTDEEISLRDRLLLIQHHIKRELMAIPRADSMSSDTCFPIVAPFVFLHTYDLKDELPLHLTFFPFFYISGSPIEIHSLGQFY